MRPAQSSGLIRMLRNWTRLGGPRYLPSLIAAVVLQGDRAAGGDAGQLGVLDHRRAVQDDRQPVPLQRDLERVPLADRLVGLVLGGDARRGRSAGIFSSIR